MTNRIDIAAKQLTKASSPENSPQGHLLSFPMVRILSLLLFGVAIGTQAVRSQDMDKMKLLDPRNYANGMTFVDDNELKMRGSDISKYKVIDTSEYVISHRSIRPFLSPQEPNGEKMLLYVGQSVTAFFSDYLVHSDSLYTKLLKKRGHANVNANNAGYRVYYYIEQGYTETENRIPFCSGETITVEDKRTPQWRIESGQKEIWGYACQQATTEYGGRVWRVWFTPEIPLAVGPWKLRALPGLILQAEEAEGLYSFVCEQIENRRIPIAKYLWHTQQVNQQQWLKFEKRMHVAPFSVFGANTLVLSGTRKGRLDETWTIPYNPIERE